MVPRLETERLVLRGHRAADHAACCALWGQETVTRFIGGRPSTGEEVWSRILRYAGHWEMLGFGYFAVTERGSDRVIGEVGLADFRRDISPPLDAPEAGWVFHPDWHGKGLAREAVAALLDWAAGRGMARTLCLIDPDNEASLGLALRLGFRETQRIDYYGKPSLLLRRE
jgi:Acetyltransferases, including N-acetylases of ribosomal proteins